VVEAATVVAGLIGLVSGVVVAHKGVHVNPNVVPDSAVYLVATKENPYPIEALTAKGTFSVTYGAGSFLGDLIRAVKAGS
jgi:hypothetical protein